jgi:hypothetical protein
MAYTVFKHNTNYEARKGLEGPFHYPNGQVLYYDDFYVPSEDVAQLQQSIFNQIRG